MHEQGVIHGNLRGVSFQTRSRTSVNSLPRFEANVLIDNDGHARLANFNSLRMISEEQSATITAAQSGSAQWMSPELLLPEQFNLKESRPNKASDYYALGMVIYEILSGKIPFYQYSAYAAVLKILRGERPTRLEEPEGGWFTDDMWEILELCWQHRPARRICAKAVLLYLEGGSPSSVLPRDWNGDEMMDVDEECDDDTEEDQYVSAGFHFPARM
jgi:serine/threonine protein kinase